MRFCGQCAHPLKLGCVPGELRARHFCVACGEVNYINPKVLVACIAYYEDRLLLCRRARAPELGLWEVPSGYVEEGECLERAAAREVAEETGVRLAPDQLNLYAILSLPKMSQVYVVFRTELPRLPLLHAGSECLSVDLKRQNEISVDEWAFQGGVCGAPANLFREIQSRNFQIHVRCIDDRSVVGVVERAYSVFPGGLPEMGVVGG